MSRSRFCRACRDWHDTAQPWPDACMAHFGVAARDAPMIRTDGMDPIRSMADGRVYDSRSGYYASVRRSGCEIVGDDRGGYGRRPEYRPQGIGQSIKNAIEKLSAR